MCARRQTHSLEFKSVQVYQLSRDQLGCRFLQRQLDEGGRKAVDLIYGEVIEHIVELTTDPFGNYLCQKLLDHCDVEQRKGVVSRISPHLVSIALNIHGTRAAQKLVEKLGPSEKPTRPEITLVVSALGRGVIQLIQDLNGEGNAL